ncbi:MAG: multiheme c-type cytochrome [Verrucomicrobiae bacterium]|nr:multiheme c-type cytochrome [Verrucomicrobiae bacterium]
MASKLASRGALVFLFATMLAHAQNGRFLGAGSCSTSGCHGGAADQSRQFVIWQEFDPHARAYATLTMGRSWRMTEALGLGDPTREPRCTICHAPHPTQIREGVSCENCHGAAEFWLRTHTRADYTHEERVRAGMRNLRGAYHRANACVACHQWIEPELLRAGHPELMFELDGQLAGMKRHWRKSLDQPAGQQWLVGQAVALRELAAQPTRELEPQRAVLEWLLQVLGENPEEPDAIARRVAAESWSDAHTANVLDRLLQTADQFEQPTAPRDVLARRAERLVLALDRLSGGQPWPELERLFRQAQSRPDFVPEMFGATLRQLRDRVRNTAP